ncbi:MAG: CoA ester lyase [Chloroflexi bacterium]|nr:CoA ester lyase [Chloroflexota bacterium]
MPPSSHANPGFRSRRALLFMPGDSRSKIEKGIGLGVDGLIMDLEDGVAVNRKTEARRVILEALTTLDFGRSERLVRINAGFMAEADLAAILPGHPDGLVLPKVESAQWVTEIHRMLTQAEESAGWASGSVRLLAIVETAAGILNLKEIATAPRLDALIFGAEDLAGDIGAIRTPEGWEVFYARSAVVLTAAAFGLQAIDTVYTDLADIEGLEADARRAAGLGYAGKLAIHPRQIEPINRVFTPTQTAIDAAQRLIEAFDTYQAQGTGVFAWEGRMVDMPMMRAAELLLAKARAAGLLNSTD